MKELLKNKSDIIDVVGKTPPTIHLKVIDHLDAAACHWLTVSPLCFIGIRQAGAASGIIGGGQPGFAHGDGKMLNIPLAALDQPELLQTGASFGSLFLAPGIGETLRINGTVTAVSASEARIAVEECYLHCAKALIRSEFWDAQPLNNRFSDAAEFVNASRFMTLATFGEDGSADLSPKGDPAGKLTRIHGEAVWFADRPGNRRVDSFRNIVTQPKIAATLLIPGSTQVVHIQGEARITTNAQAREQFTVKGKTPLIVVQVENASIELKTSHALEKVALWPLQSRVEGIQPSKIFAAHIKMNKSQGIGARLAAATVSIPKLMQKSLEKDYKDNLY